MYVYFKAVGLNYASTRKALLAMESDLIDMGIFNLIDCYSRLNSNYILLAVPKRNLARLVVKVVNSRLFLSSRIDGDFLFTYSVSK